MNKRYSRPALGAAVFLVALWSLLGTRVTVSASPAWAAPWLSLAVPAPKPMYEQIRKLNQVVIINYEVQKNEDLWSISKRFGGENKLTVSHYQSNIRSSNDLDMQTARPGMILRIANHDGTVYEVKKGDTLDSLRIGFARGRAMGDKYRLAMLDVNGYPLPDLKDPNHALKPGTILFLPDVLKPMGLGVPFYDNHYRVTSGFGMRHHPVLGITRAHRGMDMAKPYGSPVRATRSGRVVSAGWAGGYGNLIQIRSVFKGKHGPQAFIIYYGHLSKMLVHEGQAVSINQIIGRVGSTGISTGPHLHYEVRDENGNAFNPANYL